MKVLSLFDGMACGMLAMQSAGIKVDRYVAFEIDKYAVQTSSHNFPMIEHRGDVFQADFTEFRGFDFLVGGSPCTYWSIAQKNNRETEASGMGWELFSQYVRALREAQPMYFIYENNKSMSNAIRESITEAFGFEPICINSALVSAQNRQRLYWVGKRNPDGTYSKVYVDQPEDRCILLRDVLDGICEQPICADGDKGKTVTASYFKYAASDSFKKANPRMGIAEPVGATNDGKSIALKAQYHKNNISNFVVHQTAYGFQSTGVAEPIRVGTYPNDAKNQAAHDSQQYRIYSTDGNGVTLCGNGGGMGAKTGLYAIPIEFDGDIPIKAVSCADGKTYTVFRVKDGQITIKDKPYPIKLADGFYIIRKLTVSECKRLQTVPDWYEFPVSDSQAYKMLGNGWTVEVIAHLIKATQSGNIAEEQLDLFRILGV